MKKVAIIGAGFFGVSLAIHIAKIKSNFEITLFDLEPKILSRASEKNQARVHRGYHYPRSLKTAYSSNKNYPNFCEDFSDAVTHNRAFYGIAKNSIVNSRHFYTIYKRMGIPITEATKEIRDYFNMRNVENVFEVKESIFNISVIREIQMQEILKLNINLKLNTKVTEVRSDKSNVQIVYVDNLSQEELYVDYVFNCTYSMLNQFDDAIDYKFNFVHQLTEIVIYNPPEELLEKSITIMDGPFFSTLPFPSQKLHSLSHVTFTPHFAIEESELSNIYEKLSWKKYPTNFNWMIASAKKFIPRMEMSSYVESNFEIKSTLKSSSESDSRPIYLRKGSNNKIFNVFGGKLDNVYDVFSVLDEALLEA